MSKEFGRVLPSVASAIDVRDRRARQLVVADVVQAAEVNADYFSDGCFSANSEGSNAAVFAKVVLILFAVEQILRQR